MRTCHGSYRSRLLGFFKWTQNLQMGSSPWDFLLGFFKWIQKQILVGFTKRTVPEWLFPRQFPTKQTSRPDPIRVTEMPLKRKKLPDAHPVYALRSWAGCRGDRAPGGSQQQQQPTSLRPESGTLVSSHPTSGTSILWRSSAVKIPGLGASSKLLTLGTACSVNTFAKLRQM